VLEFVNQNGGEVKMSHTLPKKWLLIIVSMVLVLIVAPLLTACGGDDDDEGDAEATMSGTTSAELQEKEYRVGFLTVNAGTVDEVDQTPFMAVDEINEAGGVQVGNTIYKFKASWADSGLTASGAVAGIEKLLYDDKADFLESNPFVGGEVTRPYFESEKAITLVWDNPDMGIGPDKPYSFRVYFDTRLNNMMVLDWVRKNRPDLKKFEIINLDMARFTDVVPAEKKVWEEWGLDVHYTWYDWTTKDFYPVLTAALRHDPDTILVTMSAGNAIINQARELGFKGQFILPDMVPYYWTDIISLEDLEGLISMSPVDDSPDVPQAYKNYKAYYREETGRDITTNKTFATYITPFVAAAAMKAAGSTDPDKMKEVMETQPLTLEFPEGVTMTLQFFGKEYYGVNHNWQPPQYITVFENEHLVQKEVIPPLEQMKYVELIQKYEGTAGEYNPEEDKVDPNATDTPAQKLTVDSTIGALLDNPDTKAILMKHIPESIDERTPLFLTLRTLFELAGDRINQSKFPLIEEDLNALYGE